MSNVYSWLKKCWGYIKSHPYLCTFTLFMVWISLLDQHSIYSIIQDYRQSKSYEREKADYLEKINNYTKMLEELQTNDENLVKFAREQYYMRAADEDVFIVQEK
ncbi:MAG: hypothetical protein K5685_01595 [Bacteroidales bacterium]|nr:hypothetical protein [Bacteroidales bacterium]